MSSIPTDIVSTIIKGLGEAAPAIAKLFAAAGYDLGPMTPDAAKDFAAAESDIDRQLAAAARSDADEVLASKPKPVVHDTDPAMPAVTPPPPPSSSSR